MALSTLKNIITGSLPLDRFQEHIEQGHAIRLNRFTGSSTAFLLQALAGRHKNIVAVFPDEEAAQFFKADLDMLGADTVHLLPPTGQKPYNRHQVVDSSAMVQRSEVIDALHNSENRHVVTSADALFEKIASSEDFSRSAISLTRGDEYDPEKLSEHLVDQGYKSVKFVDEPGEFARRGGILDVFPFAGDYPVRLEFFGNEVDSIREFEPDSQRSVSYLETARLIPDVSSEEAGEKQNLLSWFDEHTAVVLFNESLIVSRLKEQYETARQAYDKACEAEEHPPAEPGSQYVSPDEFLRTLQGKPLICHGHADEQRSFDWSYDLEARPQPDFNGTIKLLRENIADLSSQGMDVYILCDNEGQRDRFEELLGEPHEELRYHLAVETLHQGFILPQTGIAVYTDHQIFNRYHRPRVRRKRYRGGISLKELRDLHIGDYVVHVDYGIGVFQGFKTITVRGTEQEAVMVRYQGDSLLYVNVSSLHKLQKYSGKDGVAPKITKLGSGEWQRKKAKTRKRVKDIARDLIKLYARRKARQGLAFSPDGNLQTELEAGFMYEETPDQMQAIDDVKSDMQSETPMDRLVCGDVGFGKTEVAVRAAFKAIADGKQVALLVPTTILADQHLNTFKERMHNFPVEIESISRFRSTAEQKKILQGTAEGKVDLLIGTHRLISKDVSFKDLGMLIVDEEQRFGVSVKEKLKEMRAQVDVMTMTATPIPRTLQFSLMGARDLSIINTPPPNRQPVQTEIQSHDPELIRDAISQEVSRGGQVFFIHNRVSNIEETADMLRELLPDIRVRFAHGQMKGKELEKIIHDFYHHKFDVLVSTNIVENGIDIANANTMIINRADQFGLSELHQLRGRVGRSIRKAYCYMITPPLDSLTDEARKRLLALEEFSDLGSGFNIAMRDLDIRGAGDILGAEQSGFINEIGYELYQKILDDAVKELRQEEFGEEPDEDPAQLEQPETAVEFDHSALLPGWYVDDNVERLNLYRKLSQARDEEDIQQWVEEINDRFGTLPEETWNLVRLTRIKLLAAGFLINKVIVRSNRIWLHAPGSKTRSGETFYEKGVFQQVLAALEDVAADRYKLVQKEDSVTFVVQEVPGLDAAIDLLQALHDSKTDTPVSVEQ